MLQGFIGEAKVVIKKGGESQTTRQGRIPGNSMQAINTVLNMPRVRTN